MVPQNRTAMETNPLGARLPATAPRSPSHAGCPVLPPIRGAVPSKDSPWTRCWAVGLRLTQGSGCGPRSPEVAARVSWYRWSAPWPTSPTCQAPLPSSCPQGPCCLRERRGAQHSPHRESGRGNPYHRRRLKPGRASTPLTQNGPSPPTAGFCPPRQAPGGTWDAHCATRHSPRGPAGGSRFKLLTQPRTGWE